MLIHQRGISLIIVLWMLVILTVMALGLSRQTRTEVQLASNYQNQAKAAALAEAGIWRGVMMARKKNAAALQGEFVHLDGRIYPLASDYGELAVSLQSTQGLVDLNRSPEELLKQLFSRFSESDEQASAMTAAVFDWRDEDELVRINGAEKADYTAAGHSYGPNNGPFVAVSELARVLGVNQQLYQQIKPYLTVYSGESRIDVSAAPDFVLAMLPSMTASDVESVMASRDNGGAVDLSLLPAETRQYIGASQVRVVRVSSQASVGGVVSGVVADIELNGASKDPIVILSWHHGLDEKFTQDEPPQVSADDTSSL